MNIHTLYEDLSTWIEGPEGSIGDQVKKYEKSQQMNFSFNLWDTDKDSEFNDSIGSFKIEIYNDTKQLDLDIPLDYGQCSMLRDYLDVILKNHKKFHLKDKSE